MLGWRTGTAVGWRPVRGLAIELVVEDRAHRAVGQRADLDGAHRRRFETIGAERPDQAHDAEAGAEALFGMRPALQDQLAQRRRRRTDRGGLAGECARRSSRRSADGSTACDRGRWCAGDCRWSADARRSARPSERPRRCAASAAPRPRGGRSGRARCRSAPRPRRGNRCRRGAAAIRRRHRARSATP